MASSYDVMNDAMSFGIHRIWKDLFIQELSPTHGTRLLDCAGGTGDITFRYLNYLKNSPNPEKRKSHVTISDINKNMLDVGKSRAEKLGWISNDDFEINWQENNAEKLSFDDETFTAYTIVFGIRNCTYPQKVQLFYNIILIKIFITCFDASSFLLFRSWRKLTEFSRLVVDFCAWNSVT